jgi:hypothetical protein
MRVSGPSAVPTSGLVAGPHSRVVKLTGRGGRSGGEGSAEEVAMMLSTGWCLLTNVGSGV